MADISPTGYQQHAGAQSAPGFASKTLLPSNLERSRREPSRHAVASTEPMPSARDPADHKLQPVSTATGRWPGAISSREELGAQIAESPAEITIA